MVFSHPLFIFAFLLAAVTLYFLVPKRCRTGRNLVLLLFSLLFYFFGEPLGIFLMLFSILANWALALGIVQTGRRRLFLALCLILNIGLLAVYKYSGFLVSNFNRLFGGGIPVPDLIMPIGISFFTFQGMSYVFDVYRGRVSVQRNPLYVATYISMFPQLIAGPIVRYETIAREMLTRDETWQDTAEGLRRFIRGLSKKAILANTLAELVAAVTGYEPGMLSAGAAWIGAVAYTLQIYFDFSGYSDMAIGLGRIFGFHFLENFNYPYIADSITDFWRRWHISLSNWFRDYVYIPLGGNRKGRGRQILNLLIVWGLTGLWHGASWNFVLWGLYFALFLILEKLFLGHLLERLPRPVGHLYALFLIVIGWVIFQFTSLSQVGAYLAAMFGANGAPVLGGDYAHYLLQEYGVVLAAGVLFSLPVVPALDRRMGGGALPESVRNLAALACFALSVIYMVSGSFNPFIYFRF